MTPAIIEGLKLVFQIILLAIQAGKTVADLMPEVAMFVQLMGGTPLSPEQRKVLDDRHEVLTTAALRDLGPAPTEGT